MGSQYDGHLESTVIKESIPSPVLKNRSAVGVQYDILDSKGAKSGYATSGNSAEATTDAIAEMERRIKEVKARKAASMEKHQEEQDRAKHTINETKVERARRLAKEKEDQRWKATLPERVAMEKQKREAAKASMTNHIKSDTAWQKSPSKCEPAVTSNPQVVEEVTSSIEADKVSELQREIDALKRELGEI